MASSINVFSILCFLKLLNSSPTGVPFTELHPTSASGSGTVSIRVGTQNGGDTHCGCEVYLESPNNPKISVPFNFDMNYGEEYTQTFVSDAAMNPSNTVVSISAAGCTDSLEVEQVKVNGNQYFLADTSYGKLANFWIDGNDCLTDPVYPCDDPPNNYYCINGIICMMDRGDNTD